MLLKALVFLAVSSLSGVASSLSVANLRCEYAKAPLGVDSSRPRLFWELQSHARGQRQTAYRVLVASSRARLASDVGDLWDSGRVESDADVQVPYSGVALHSAQQAFWKVRAWDMQGKPTNWSPVSTWTMGILSDPGWHSQWVSGAEDSESQSLLLRRDFSVGHHLRRALAFVCGLGCYEITLNGKKVGNELFPPGWTKYDKTCLYETYDVTELLHAGQNTAGLLLGNGMYNVKGGRYTKFTGSFGPLKAIGQLRLEYADGRVEFVGTDSNWRQMAGPLTFSDVYGGEDYDARREPPGWNRPGFNDSGWKPARVTTGPGGLLKGLSCSAPPIRTFEVLKPINRTVLRPGLTVYDLGQNASLMPRLSVRGPAGSVVRIIPAELLGKNGLVDRGSCGGGQAYWQYTLTGHGTERWFPKFFYSGCRYLQVECLSAAATRAPRVVSMEGVVVHSASPPLGEFSCSNELFNRIHRLVRWAQESNMMSVMTDCPHREKLGWLEEDHLNGPALRYEFDLARLFTKMSNDMADSQLTNGLVPDIAPEYVKFSGGFRDSPEWGSACVLVPWQQYEFTADRELLRRHYGMMARYVAYLAFRATNDIVSHGLGDWYDLGPNPPGVAQLTPIALTATAFYYRDTFVLAQIAELLGKADDAQKYQALAERIRDAFNHSFFHPDRGCYASDSQCANSIPLAMGLVDPTNRDTVLAHIVKDVRDHGNALTAGDVGYRFLLRALAEGGRSDVIFDMNNQSDKPGYGFQLEHGATSLTEAWDADRHSSQNHFMLGQILEWFYHDLGGISSAPDGPGFKHIIIKPAPVGDLTWARTSYHSLHGPITCKWRRANGSFFLDVTIPANTSGTLYLPAGSADSVTESGRRAQDRPGVRFLRQEEGCAVYSLDSGSFRFRSSLPAGGRPST